MASLKVFSLILLLHLPLSLSSTLVLPLAKDPSTNHYLTRIYHGSSLEPVELLLDLNSPFLWLDCSPSLKPTTINCRSIQCTSAIPNPSCPSSSSECSLPLQNPLTGVSTTGELVEGSVSFNNVTLPFDQFLLGCAPRKAFAGLPTRSRGVFGLGKTRIGAISQISHFFDYPKKFSVCLSSQNGMILSGNEVFKSMTYTPLLDTTDSSSYLISLKSLKIQHKKLTLDDPTYAVKISTVHPYTIMETRIYQEFVSAFITEVDSLNMMNMKRVPPHAGFEVCYGVQGSAVVIPLIDLVLQSEMVKWRIYGHNSMVKINDEVMCLGFLDGGVELKGGSIILGAHQLEDNLLEFDLGSSMLGFSSSLLKLQTSCAQLSLSAVNKGGGGGGGGTQSS